MQKKTYFVYFRSYLSDLLYKVILPIQVLQLSSIIFKPLPSLLYSSVQ